MADTPEGARQLISDQIAITVRLQQGVLESLERNDSQTAARLVETLDKAFGTFLQGVKEMAIDVSGLKNVLSTTSQSQSVLNALTERVSKLEETIKSASPEAIANLQTEVSDIKTALQELNTAAASASTAS